MFCNRVSHKTLLILRLIVHVFDNRAKTTAIKLAFTHSSVHLIPRVVKENMPTCLESNEDCVTQTCFLASLSLDLFLLHIMFLCFRFIHSFFAHAIIFFYFFSRYYFILSFNVLVLPLFEFTVFFLLFLFFTFIFFFLSSLYSLIPFYLILLFSILFLLSLILILLFVFASFSLFLLNIFTFWSPLLYL